MHKEAIRWLLVLAALVLVAAPKPSLAQNGLQKVNHIVIVMQENHSFDNYFGVYPSPPAVRITRPSNAHGGCRTERPCLRGWFVVHARCLKRPALLQFQQRR